MVDFTIISFLFQEGEEGAGGGEREKKNVGGSSTERDERQMGTTKN